MRQLHILNLRNRPRPTNLNLPPEARLTSQGRVADIFDKGKAAVVITENTVRDETDDPATLSPIYLHHPKAGGGP